MPRFKQSASIKTRLALSVFIVSSSCFLLFFIMAYATGMINQILFVSVPIFFVVYSCFVIALSLYWGNTFERPFKKLQKNIDTFIHAQGKKTYIVNNFTVDEFILIQEFIMNTFSEIEKKYFLFNHLNQIATQTAHDIRSPISILNVCLHQSAEISEEERLLVTEALDAINKSFNNLLHEFRAQRELLYQHYSVITT